MPSLSFHNGTYIAGYKSTGASQEAAQGILSTITDKQRIIYNVLVLLPDSTADEIAVYILEHTQNTDAMSKLEYTKAVMKLIGMVRPRITELANAGLIEVSGRGKSFNGNAANLYRICNGN